MALLTKPGVEDLSSQASSVAQVGLDTRIAFIAGSPGKRTVRESSRLKGATRSTTVNRLREALYCPGSSYGLSTFVGLLTYVAYGSLNDAWSNPALIVIALFMFLSSPLYSKYSNRIEGWAARLTGLETGGRVARYLFQFLDNTLLLWVFVWGEVIEPSALDAIGGFFATAAWITIVSQGGQYLATRLARKGIGNADRNVVWAIVISVTISALAVSGVMWIQPAYVAISLVFGVLIFGIGVITDAKQLLERQRKVRFFGRGFS